MPVISRTITGAFMYILGGVVLVIGTLLWIALQKKFKNDIKDYKALISEILESQLS
jgi:hypothetical protein